MDGKINIFVRVCVVIQVDLRGTILSHATCLRHTSLRHFLGHSYRKVLNHVVRSYNFFCCKEVCCMQQNRTM